MTDMLVAEARAREERERQERMRKELEAERERARAADEAARQGAITAQEEEERRRRAREEEIRVREERAAAEEAARRAAEPARKAREEQEAVEKQFREWIQPVVMPTTAELKAAKVKIQYKDGALHFAVAGSVMGSGTLKIPDWQYFNSQGLCVIVLFNNPILMNCRRYPIPTFIVRSKADQHIRNLMKEMGYDSDDEGQTTERMYKAAREQFIAETHRSVKENLQEAQLPDQRVYIVSHKSVLGIVRDKTPKRTIDELELLRDLHSEGYKSRKHSFDVPNGAYTAAQSL
ncbi:hypothetical protein L210DRAFT_3616150 [Boletus edulis BED1]|uniref:Uncharacterized protein n=1 Tax=Boletus edulis BED1 TaxID=1328754 RepID=A0AAD4BB36_BOLED|nr:hypothetical protein L210DRAFT_3616150 [Boletus edulis BED1]